MKQNSTILKSGIATLIIIGGVILFGSCEKYSFLVETVNPTDTVHFQTEIQPIFTANLCVMSQRAKEPGPEGRYFLCFTYRIRLCKSAC